MEFYSSMIFSVEVKKGSKFQNFISGGRYDQLTTNLGFKETPAVGAAVNIIFLGVYGYFLPANQRVGLSVPQVTSTLTTLFAGTAINISMFKDSESYGDIQWGTQSKVGTYAIFLLAISFTWLMGLMGYIRSSVRLFWHVTEVVRDNSADAYTLTIGEAGKMLTFNALFVWVQFVVVFWVGSLTAKKSPAQAPEGVPVPAQQQ